MLRKTGGAWTHWKTDRQLHRSDILKSEGSDAGDDLIGGQHNMKPEAVFRVTWLASLLCILPGTLRAQYKYLESTKDKKVIKNILILPSEATLTKYGLKGGEPMVDESHSLEAGISSVVREAIKARGYNVLPDAFGPADLDQNPDLKYALADLQARYDKLQRLLKKKPKDVRKGRFTLGDEVANFNPGATADALVFVRATGLVETTGMKTFVILTGMGIATNRVVYDIAVVDAQTGAILYFVKSHAGGDFVGKPDSMKQSIRHSFAEF
jgi:hypothetical protein